MVADQHRHAVATGGLDQRAHLVQADAHRLLHQHWHPGLDAVQGRAHVQVVGGGDQRCLRAHLLQHRTVLGVVRHPAFGGEGRGLLAGIGHRAEPRGRYLTQVLTVLTAHAAGADQGDA